MKSIHKAAGILIENRKLLVERSRGKEFFISPGGSVEAGETERQALVRELGEEFGISVLEKDLEPFGNFTAEAANHPGQVVNMAVYIVKDWQGTPAPHSEVEELAWVNTNIPAGMKVGSIFEHQVLPRLKEEGRID